MRFSDVKKGARARAYESALIWLDNTGIIYRASAVKTDKRTLINYAGTGCFKAYALDLGLLEAMGR